jgi:predicted dehydrogenase
MKLRVGLIGLGDQWQSRHRPALLALSDRFEVRAICCEIAHLSKQVARDFGASPMDGFRAMIERDDIDAVLALAPDWVGPLPLVAACEAGKAVFSVAALDISPDQIDEIRTRIENSGVAFVAELPRRYSPATIRLKELIATRLGPPRMMFCHERMSAEEQSSRLRRGNYCPLTWRRLMELVDWCCDLVGQFPNSVTSAIHEQHTDDRDVYYQMMNLNFPHLGAQSTMAQISIGHYIPSKWPDAIAFRRPSNLQICCENGMAFVDLPHSLTWFDEAGPHTESLEMDRPVGEQMLDHFHRSVTSLVHRPNGLEDAYRALTIVSSANDSATQGNRVELNFE